MLTPGSPVTYTASSSPGPAMTRCAVGRSNAANDSGPTSPLSPNAKNPAIVKRSFGPAESTSTVSPTLEPVVACGLDVHGDLARRRRGAAPPSLEVDEPQRPAIGPADERHAERRHAPGADRRRRPCRRTARTPG